MKTKAPSELTQIDSVVIGGFWCQRVQGGLPGDCPGVAEGAHAQATSCNAIRSLKYLHSPPFKLQSIQVDSGSEFRDEFEQARKDLGIKLYVLLPRKPNDRMGVLTMSFILFIKVA